MVDDSEQMVHVKVSLRVQYMYKDLKTDLPNMGPLNTYEVQMDVTCPSDLVQFLDVYVGNVKNSSNPDVEQVSYCAGKDLSKKWKKWLKSKYKDSFSGNLTDSDVVEGAISCSLEDAIQDTVESTWDSELAKKLGATPEIPDGYRLAGRFIHVDGWKLDG